MKYAVLGIAFVLAIAVGINHANAENGLVGFPEISDDFMTGQHVDVNYHDDNKWTITVTTQFQVEKSFEVPDVIYYPGIDGQIYSINLRDGFELHNNPMASDIAEDVEPEVDVNEVRLEQKKAEIKAELDEIYGKYNECLEQFKVENPLGYEAWLRTAALQPFEVPDDSNALYIKQYSVQEKKAEMKWQECEGAKKYKWIGEYEANKSIEEPLGFKLDETNSPDTPEPVTQEDKDAEEKIAADFKCSNLGKQQGLCNDYLSGDYYVPEFSRLPAWYGQYLNDKGSDPNTVNAVNQALQTQCDVYGPLYESKRGNENQYPEWLLHCPIPVEDDDE